MHMALLCRFSLFAWVFSACLANARIADTIFQAPLNLGSYDPAQTDVAKLSKNGRLFGQIDDFGNVRVWALDMPASPLLELPSHTSLGQEFENIVFSDDNKYIILDSTIINTSLPTKGQIVIISTDNFVQQSFDTYVWGGTMLSKYALSNTGLLAYVPKENSHQINFVDLATRNENKITEHGYCAISALAFDPTFKKIAIKDVCASSIRIRDIATGALLKDLELETPMPDDYGSPDQTLFYWGRGTMLAVNSDVNPSAFALDAETGSGQFPFQWFDSLAMFCSNDSNRLAIADLTASLNIQIVNNPTLYPLQPFGLFSLVSSGAFSPDDGMLVAGSSDGQVAVYDARLNLINGGALAQAEGIVQLAFVNKRTFISLSDTNTLVRWTLSH